MTPRQSADTRSPIIRAGVLAALLSLAAPASAAGVLERVVAAPCRALALDQEPYVAALGNDSVTVFDKRGQHEEKLPASLRASQASGTTLDIGVYFGRDYRVRVAGTAHTPQADQVRYFRSLPAGIVPAPDELGPLGRPGAPGLVALLGTADPEIVCRPGMQCLIKRVSGWGRASAPADLLHVGLSLGTGWAIAGTTLFTLDKDWVALPAGTWRRADTAFIRGREACVVEHDQSLLHHFDGTVWKASAAPISGPRTLWGATDAFWIAGDGGAVVFDGGNWVKVSQEPIAQVLGRSASDVWLCSPSGTYRYRGSATSG